MNDHANKLQFQHIGLRGYSDRPSAAPGETVQFHLSAEEAGTCRVDLVRLIHGDTNPAGPGFREEVIDCPVNGHYPIAPQRTQFGSYVEIDDHGTAVGSAGLTLHAFINAGLPHHSRQAILSRWAADRSCGWTLGIEEGRLTARLGDGTGTTAEIISDRALFAGVWYSVTLVFDPDSATLRLTQRCVLNRVNSVFGPVVPLDSDSTVEAPCHLRPVDACTPVLIGGNAESATLSGRTWVTDIFNGKVDSPSLYDRALPEVAITALSGGNVPTDPSALAAWDFSACSDSDEIRDVTGHGLHGRCINQPERAVTGWNWDSSEENFRHAPHQYGAIHFHEDSLDDCRWIPNIELTVPHSLPSDCYALRVRCRDAVDHIPLFVLPPKGTATAEILFLIPTCTYLAYANWQIKPALPARQGAPGRTYVLHDFDVELNIHTRDYGLSLYDTYADGRIVKYSSWRRPIVNMRPMHRHREFAAPWGFSADLYLVDWLNAEGLGFDVATDHDLIEQGAELLSRYRVVITGTHPEYYTSSMIDAWEDYLANGGRGMYLGGNGMYWVSSLHPEKPWVVEVRKGESGTTRNRTTPGENYHSTSGERGGLWRYRNRAPQKVWGTGHSAFGFDSCSYYVQLPDAREPSVEWIFEGVDPTERIGDFGLIGAGAAGFEVDKYDLKLGTPPHTMLLASSTAHTRNYLLATEEMSVARPAIHGVEHPSVRGDMTYFTTAHGGGMFSTSSIAWCGSLSSNRYDNNVARITGNVLRRFVDPAPLPDVVPLQH